jgi:hypothetical protein
VGRVCVCIRDWEVCVCIGDREGGVTLAPRGGAGDWITLAYLAGGRVKLVVYKCFTMSRGPM